MHVCKHAHITCMVAQTRTRTRTHTPLPHTRVMCEILPSDVGTFLSICSNIFEDVQKNSIQIWKFGMYFLVVEYDTKPTLVPPLIILEHVVLMVKFICRRTCCKKPDEGNGQPYVAMYCITGSVVVVRLHPLLGRMQ